MTEIEEVPTRTRWQSFTRRLTVWRAAFAFGCLGSLSYLLWMAFGTPPRMPISAETTHFLGPIDEDGDLDIEAAIRRSRGWPEPTPHVWQQLFTGNSDYRIQYDDYFINAMTSPTGESSHQKRQRYRRAKAIPFTSAEEPYYAEAVTSNEAWYEAVLASEPPAGSPHWSRRNHRWWLADRFRLRAMHQLSEGDIAGALQSLRLVGRSIAETRNWALWLDDQRTATSVGRETMESARAALLFALPYSDDLDAFAMKLSQPVPYPSLFAQTIDECQRYHDLAWYADPELMAESIDRYVSGKFDPQQIRLNWYRNRINWPRFADFYHAYVDEVVKCMRIDNDLDRQAALRQLASSYRDRLPGPNLRSWKDVAFSDGNDFLEATVVQSANRIISDWIVRDRNARRLTRLVVYLARYRRETGQFPVALKDIRIPENDRACLRVCPAGGSWFYERQGPGFRLSTHANSPQPAMQWPPADDAP